jgi:hypothetical protein
MTATDAQVRIIMRERDKGRSQEQAAASANLGSRKTVAKYERLNQLPSQLRQPRAHRTRPDPFAEDWGSVEAQLAQAPTLEAKALFEWLCDRHPGKYQEGQLRTFQRHVRQWRALHQERVAVLEQVHQPGEVLQADGVWLTELGVTLQGEPLAHLLIHCVLPYSNWEWGRVAQSESLNALRVGLQSTLQKLGRVPQCLQTDNSSAATFWPGAKGPQSEPPTPAPTAPSREYTEGYLQLLAHYDLAPRTTHRQAPHENGDVEGANGALKRALVQHLLLRGSRDFADLGAYEAFVQEVLERRNRPRQARLAEELAVMRPLRRDALVTHSHLRVRVSRASLIRVQGQTYSVPTSLIGEHVNVHIHEWHLEVYYQTHQVLTLPRLCGAPRQHIDYRHLIDSLLRKPGGFRAYRYREAFFPTLTFQRAWEQLNARHAPRKADLIYLRVLHLAAQHLESDVGAILEELLGLGEPWDETVVAQRLQPTPAPVPAVAPVTVDLTRYDHLLHQEVGHDA